MYIPTDFEENRLEILYAFIQKYPFAHLISLDQSNLLQADHLPFASIAEDGQLILLAHIARNNPLYQSIKPNTSVLVIFQGEQGYISPNWYPSKFEHHRHVPTWNYQVVHARGKLEFIENEKQLRGILARLTRHHEQTQPKPWRMTDAPVEYIQEQLQHIIGLQIKVETLQGKFKLSQNRNETDLKGVIQGLADSGQDDLAHAVQQAYQAKQFFRNVLINIVCTRG